ncbi:hypothetical protein CYJ80_10725 [Lactobacillus crispatus]|nr:hypothetical protein CYJ80_10725 [Lactobacillus crispatus]
MYELLAIKELIENGLINSKNVSPIIEPVRDNSTFNNLLKLAKKNDYNLNIISNPQVGEYKAVDQLPGLIKDNNMKNSIIIQNNNTVTISKDDLLFYDAPVEVLDDSNRNSTINVVQDSLVFNKSRIGNPKHVVVFNDCFNRQDRNADYSENQDENFSEYHLVYKEVGYEGFGDYSIIGKDYQDSGFAPYAVAIHIVYFDKNNILRIHHFVSDSNDDMYDPANKLHEALGKLHNWVNSSSFDKDKNSSEGLMQLDTLFSEDRYPGLGFLKKLEIMHHLEIMNRYLRKTGNTN